MTLSDIYQEIQQRSGDTGLTSTQMNLWVNLAIQQWAKEDWPDTLATDSTQTTTAGTTEYTLPTDNLKVLGVRIGKTTTSTELDAKEYSFVRYENKNVSTTGPLYYINPVNGTIGFVPTPDVTGLPIYIRYHAYPADLTVLTSEPPFPKTYHEAVVFFALKKYWETQDEFDKSNYYDVEWNRMLDDMKTDLMKQSRGQLGRMKDVRELQYDNQPWVGNIVE